MPKKLKYHEVVKFCGFKLVYIVFTYCPYIFFCQINEISFWVKSFRCEEMKCHDKQLIFLRKQNKTCVFQLFFHCLFNQLFFLAFNWRPHKKYVCPLLFRHETITNMSVLTNGKEIYSASFSPPDARGRHHDALFLKVNTNIPVCIFRQHPCSIPNKATSSVEGIKSYPLVSNMFWLKIE